MDVTRPAFGHEEIELLAKCLESGWVTQGPLTKEFERLVAAEQDVEHAVATTSCTAALHLAMLALGIGPGDEVIVPSFTWVTSASCAEYVGARPVLVDIDLDTFNIDPAAAAAAITEKTRAILAVHLFGLAAPMDELTELARRHDLFIVEDAACGIGTTYADQKVGAIGDIGCFSFHPRKIVTTGEGGMVTTNDSEIADTLGSLRNHGATGLPPEEADNPGPWAMTTFRRLGFNLRLSDIQAAVGIAQMRKLHGLLSERRSLALRYRQLLGDIPGIELPDGDGHTYQSFVIRVPEGGRGRRNAIMSHLVTHGINTRPGTHAVHRLDYYKAKYGFRSDQFPNSAHAEDATITLPLFPSMTEADQARVARALEEALSTSTLRR